MNTPVKIEFPIERACGERIVEIEAVLTEGEDRSLGNPKYSDMGHPATDPSVEIHSAFTKNFKTGEFTVEFDPDCDLTEDEYNVMIEELWKAGEN